MHFSSAVPTIRRFAVVSFVCATLGSAVSVRATGNDALLAIDQDRPGVIERIVSKWAAPIARSDAQMPVDELRSMLEMLRADQLRAASLAATLDGVRDVLANAMVASSTTKPALRHTKALGDTTIDTVYTPVTPCRLVETRGAFAAVYQGNGTASHTPVPFAQNEIRTYAVQGGNGVCLSQLPVGLGASAVQLQVFGMPTSAASGDIEILPQGSVFGATATMVYVGSIAFNTVSTAARINPANNQISVQVRGGGAHVAIDVVGYFKRPGNYAASHTISGVAATDSGGLTNTASGDYSTVSGGRNNTASGQNSTVAGGYVNTASGEADAVAGGFVNTASGGWSTVPGGFQNVASGTFSFAAGVNAHADRKQCFVFANWETEPATPPSCLNATNIARFIMNHGLSVDYFSARSDGGGTRWVAIGDLIAGQTIATWTGGFLSDTGVWVDKPPPQSRMTDFQPVDVRQVLAKVVALPITTWRYKDAERGVRHMGPLADDFHAAFGIGYGPRAIAGMDARGVTLAAIQGLHRLVQDRDATIAAQQSEIDALSERVKRLERHRSASINE